MSMKVMTRKNQEHLVRPAAKTRETYVRHNLAYLTLKVLHIMEE